MFNNKTKGINPIMTSNIIGQGSHLEGHIDTIGNLRVEGRVTGSIQTKAKVVLSHTAQVDGNIVAQNGEIAGEVKGVIEVMELLVLKSTAVVWGDIVASKLVFEEGACFDGKCKIGKEDKKERIEGGTVFPVTFSSATSQIFALDQQDMVDSLHSKNNKNAVISNQ